MHSAAMKRRKHTRWSRKYPEIEYDTEERVREREDKEENEEEEVAIEDLISGREIGSSLGMTVDEEDDDGDMPVPGSAPGIDRHPEINIKPEPGTIKLRVIDYGPESVHFREFDDVDAFLSSPKPPGCTNRWLNVDGINAYVINRLREQYHFHTLAAEDVLITRQRPKIDGYEGYLFISARMMMIQDEHLANEALSIFVFSDTLITFQEETGDMWDPIRDRLKIKGSRLRTNDITFLLYSLVDALVDHLFPILERYGDLLEEMEENALENPKTENLYRIIAVKRELTLLRRVLWPVREIVDILYRDEKRGLPTTVKPYLRDVLDHCTEILDLIESYRETCGSLTELTLSASNMRLNEVIKVLTALAAFFIPTTFLASVYGMNFEFLPELHWKYGYPAFWAVCILITIGLWRYFRSKGWLER